MSNINWLLVLSLIISIVSLLVSYFSMRYSRQRVRLEQRKYEELQSERARRRFDIAVKETIKEEIPKFKPCSIWAIKLIARNRTDEAVLLNGLVVQLSFRQRPRPAKPFLRLLVDLVLLPAEPIEPDFSLSFELYKPGLSMMWASHLQPMIGMPHWMEFIPRSTYLVNWEARQPIRFDERHWYRGPAAGGKEIWMLFGKLPIDLARQLSQQGLYLKGIECRFYTDSGEVTVSGSYAIGQGVMDEFVAELDQLAQTFINDSQNH